MHPFSRIPVSASLLILLAACASEPVKKSHTPHHENTGKTNSTKPNLVSKAQSLYQKNDLKGAIRVLETISVADLSIKERSEYWNLKGLIALNQKNHEIAAQNFRRAIEENLVQEYRGYYQFNLATALHGYGNEQESFDILSAIDLSSIDQPQQNKVLFLKEKVSRQLEITKKKTAPKPEIKKPVTEEVTAGTNADASPTPSTQPKTDPQGMLTSPDIVYDGPLERKRIGLLVPLTGKYESYGKKVQRSVELALQNSKNPDAKEFELMIVDGGETAESQVKAFQKLVEEDHVITVIGPVISKGIELLAQKAVYYQVPLITLAQVQSPMASHLFFCSVSNKDQVLQTVQYGMSEKGFRKFAVLAPSNKPGEEMAQAFKDEVLARNGEIAHFEFYEPNITDFRAAVDKVLSLAHPEKRSEELKALEEKRRELNITRKTTRTAQYYNLPPIVDFDAVFIADDAKTAGQIIPTFTYRDAKNLKFIGISSWNSSQLVQRAQDQAEDAIFPVAFNTIKPSVDTKLFFDLYTTNYSTAPGELDALAFDAASLTIQALSGGPSTREEMRMMIETIGTVQGATGEFSIKEHRCARMLPLAHVRKGKFEIIREEGSN
jgi:outer membrane PBP1 activator LpoA protein